MKNKCKCLMRLVSSLLLLLTYASSNAQSLTEDNSPPIYEQMDASLQHLDMSEVTTGLLIDRAIGVGDCDRYTGNLATMTLADINTLGGVYADLSAAAVSPAYLLPDPATAYMDAVRNYQAGQPIPFVLLSMRYHRFKEDALNNNLLTHSNGCLYDVPNRPASPYQQGVVYVASPVVHRVQNSRVVFDFGNQYVFNNFTPAFSQIAIDFGDGNGYQTISTGQSKTIQYGGSGRYNITVRWTRPNGSQKYAQSYIYIEEQSSSRYSIEPDLTIPASQLPEDDVFLNIFYACPEEGLQRPFIVINGFESDLVDRTYESLFEPNKLGFVVDGNSDLKLTDLMDEYGYDHRSA